jgi:hypothetical protein
LFVPARLRNFKCLNTNFLKPALGDVYPANDVLSLAGGQAYMELLYSNEREDFLIKYMSHYLAHLQKFFFKYDHISNIFTFKNRFLKKKKFRDYKLCLHNIFFKKKLYNIFKLRQKKNFIKRYSEIIDITSNLITNYSTYNILDNKADLYVALNAILLTKINYLQFIYYLKKLINCLKISLKYRIFDNQVAAAKSSYLYNTYRYINNYEDPHSNIYKLKSVLSKLDFKKKKRRLDTLLKIKKIKEDEYEEANKNKLQKPDEKKEPYCFDIKTLSQEEVIKSEEIYYPITLTSNSTKFIDNSALLKDYRRSEIFLTLDQRNEHAIYCYIMGRNEFFSDLYRVNDYLARTINLSYLHLLDLKLRQNILNNELLREYARHCNIEIFDSLFGVDTES